MREAVGIALGFGCGSFVIYVIYEIWRIYEMCRTGTADRDSNETISIEDDYKDASSLA